MPTLIRLLGLTGETSLRSQEQEVRRVLLREAIAHLSRKRAKRNEQSGASSELIALYQRRLDSLPAEMEVASMHNVNHSERKTVMLEALQTERDALIRLRDDGEINEEILRTLQYELDLTESRIHTGATLEN
jgi:monovalent cation/hydrogen antiporter